MAELMATFLRADLCGTGLAGVTIFVCGFAGSGFSTLLPCAMARASGSICANPDFGTLKSGAPVCRRCTVSRYPGYDAGSALLPAYDATPSDDARRRYDRIGGLLRAKQQGSVLLYGGAFHC